jgi:hypothetical protein
MESLLDAAANTYVEVNSGAASVISRAIQAATNPTEGQRMLQLGFDGAILGGESREKITTSYDIDGMKRVDRLMEHSVVNENGQAVLVQSVQQSAQQLPPVPDIEMATKADLEAVKSNSITKIHFDTNITTISALISDSMKGVVEIVKTTGANIVAVTTLVAKMREDTDKMREDTDKMREDTDKKIKTMKKKMQVKNEENDAKDAERDAKDAERDAKDEERDAKDKDNEINMKAKDKQRKLKDRERDAKDKERDVKDKERDAKDKERDELIASLQRDRSNHKKRPADNQGEGGIQKKKQASAWSNVAKNIHKKNGANIFRWEKSFQRITHWGKDFKTIEEAAKNMAEYFQNLAAPDTTANDAD